MTDPQAIAASDASLTGPVADGPVRYDVETVMAGWRTSAADAGEAELRLVDLAPLAKVSLHAAPAGPFATDLGVECGAVELFDDGLLVVGVAPGEWLALAPGASDTLVAQLEHLAGADDVAVVDLTHGLAAFRLLGRDSFTVLGRLVEGPVTGAGDRDGSATATLVDGVRTLLVRDDLLAQEVPGGHREATGPVPDAGDLVSSVVLVCDRSQAIVLRRAILAAGADVDVVEEGYGAYRRYHADA